MRLAIFLLSMVLALPASAADVNVIGLFPGKAVVVVNRGAPRTLSVGQRTPEGVLLVSVDATSAVLEVDGKRDRVEIGQHFETPSETGARTSTTLAPDSRGHYMVDGAINGGHMRFMVDTGASDIALSAQDAQRLGIDYRGGRRVFAVVADGRRVPVYQVKLDSVTVGAITLLNVEASVQETGSMGFALLGNTFLNRTEMRREGPNLTLTKRY
jgi:aspartyl protease family protein